MYIRKTTYRTDRHTYTKHLLVESESTPEGPRQKTVCSLGSLSPGPRKKWLDLARKLLTALGGSAGAGSGGPAVGGVEAGTKPPSGVTVHPPGEGTVKPGVPGEDAGTPVIDPDQIRVEQASEAGPVRAGHAVWTRLEVDTVLREAGLPPRAVKLAEMITLNLLTAPKPGAPLVRWARQTVLPCILGEEPGALVKPALCRQLDRLPPKRAAVEKALAAAEQRLFGTDNRGLVFDLRGVTFAAGGGPAAGSGAASQARSARLQLAAGLVLDRMGFVKVHEPFGPAGQNLPKLAAALRLLGRRSGMTIGAVVALDREEATPANLALVRKLGHRCLVVGDGSEASSGATAKPGATKAKPAAGSAAPPGADQGDVGGDEAERIRQRLAAHDGQMAQLSGSATGTPLLDQLPLTREARLFLLLLAGRLLSAAELLLDRGGIKRPWHVIREVLRRHQAVTLAVPLGDGRTMSLERETGSDAEREAVYKVLGAVGAGYNSPPL